MLADLYASISAHPQKQILEWLEKEKNGKVRAELYLILYNTYENDLKALNELKNMINSDTSILNGIRGLEVFCDFFVPSTIRRQVISKVLDGARLLIVNEIEKKLKKQKSKHLIR